MSFSKYPGSEAKKAAEEVKKKAEEEAAKKKADEEAAKNGQAHPQAEEKKSATSRRWLLGSSAMGAK